MPQEELFIKKECKVPGHAAPALVLLQNTREACPEMNTSLLEQVVTLSRVHTKQVPSL